MEATWSSHFKDEEITRPSSLNDVTRSICNSFIVSNGGGFLPSVPRMISLVFLKFMFMLLDFDQLTSCWIMSGILLGWFFLRISDVVVSSMNLCTRHSSLNPSIRMTKVSGPSQVPWGIPLFSWSQIDKIVPIFTRCWRLSKNENIHLMMYAGTPNVISLVIKMEWSTWSNALA